MAITLSNRRTTVLGISYLAEERYTTLVVGDKTACNCGMDEYNIECAHRRAALAREQRYEVEAVKRAEYCDINLIYA